jgi:NADH:ubiquinone oxidoreductase subunit E
MRTYISGGACTSIGCGGNCAEATVMMVNVVAMQNA